MCEQPSFQDGLDTFIAVIAKEQGPLTGPFHLLVAIFFCQAQDPLGLPQIPHGVLREDRTDEFFGVRAILCGLPSAVRGCGHKIGQFLGRIITEISHPLTRISCTAMGFDELMVVEDPDQRVGPPYP